MLPYGALWKLDQMLHPAAPPHLRTAAMRRRQALFYLVFGILIVSVFLIPYHVASIRRMHLDADRRLRGVSAPKVDGEMLLKMQEHSMVRLQLLLAAHDAGENDWESKFSATRTTSDFFTVFYHHPRWEVQLVGMFDHPLPRSIAGAGAGTVWGLLGDAKKSTGQRNVPVVTRRQTVAEVANATVPPGEEGTAKKTVCVVSLRRDYLVSRLGDLAGRDGDLLSAFRAAVLGFSELKEIGLSVKVDETTRIAVSGNATEATMAHLFLWIANDAALPEEMLNRALAGCNAPLSRSLEVSFDWRADAGNNNRPRTAMAATLHEVEEAQPQYVCLCSRRRSAPDPTLPAKTAGIDVNALTLSLFDPRAVPGSRATSCADVCV